MEAVEEVFAVPVSWQLNYDIYMHLDFEELLLSTEFSFEKSELLRILNLKKDIAFISGKPHIEVLRRNSP